MERKRIGFLINDITAIGGTERITILLANCFANYGHEVIIYSCSRSYEQPQFPLSNNIRIHYLTTKAPNSLRIFPFKYICRLRPLTKALKASPLDFLLCQSLPMSIIGLLAKKASKTKILACEHTSYNYYAPFIRKLSNSFYNHFDALVLINKTDYLLRKQARVRNPVFIPNMVSLSPSNSEPNFDNKCILAVGRLEFHKGFDRLIAAMPKVVSYFPDWRLRIVGIGSERESLLRQIEDLKLTNNVSLTGAETEINRIYSGASFVVVPSRIEGFGLVLLEASAYSLPIISFDCPSGPRDILEGNGGILVEDGDVEALSNAMLTLMRDKNKWLEFKQNSSNILDRYSPKSIYPLWKNLFSSLENPSF